MRSMFNRQTRTSPTSKSHTLIRSSNRTRFVTGKHILSATLISVSLDQLTLAEQVDTHHLLSLFQQSVSSTQLHSPKMARPTVNCMSNASERPFSPPPITFHTSKPGSKSQHESKSCWNPSKWPSRIFRRRPLNWQRPPIKSHRIQRSSKWYCRDASVQQ